MVELIWSKVMVESILLRPKIEVILPRLKVEQNFPRLEVESIWSNYDKTKTRVDLVYDECGDEST